MSLLITQSKMLLSLTDSALSEQPSLLKLSEQPVTFCVEALLCLPQHCFLFSTALTVLSFLSFLSFLSSFAFLRRTLFMHEEKKARARARARGRGRGRARSYFSSIIMLSSPSQKTEEKPEGKGSTLAHTKHNTQQTNTKINQNKPNFVRFSVILPRNSIEIPLILYLQICSGY